MPQRFNAAAWLVDRNVDEGRGGNVAVVYRDQQLTYTNLLEQVWVATNGLRALGVRPEERVAMIVNDEPAFVAWFLGALRMGAVPVPLSTMLTAKDLGFVVDDARARLTVVSPAYVEHLPTIADLAPELTAAVIVGDAGAEAAECRVPVHSAGEFDDGTEAPVATTWDESPGFWLYTSGTTGKPKGAMHRHIDLKSTADTYARSVLNIGEADRSYSVAKLFFAYGLGGSLTFAFSVGGTAILNPDRPTPASVAEILATHQPTVFYSLPGFCAAMLDAEVAPEAFASVRVTITAGETLPAALHDRFRERFGVPVLDGIGTTEALHIFLSNHLGAERPGTSGTPVDGYEAKLLDEADLEVNESDTPGFLHIKGESIATGYWCRAAATRQAFRGEWLRTGDVYTRSADGYYTFLGRNHDMIKPGGIWVSPAEVENALVKHDDVLEAAVVGARDAAGLETVVAFVVPRAGHSIDADAIERHCRTEMAAFKRPRRVIPVDGLPKTATGKIRRFVLRELLAVEDI
ncbi:MAG: benzoate-CoA ligase family protein [Acidimicrobiales bacterium]